MINAYFIRKHGRYTGFSVTGHADYGEYGSDIVCSAVSAVAQTILAGLIENVEGVEYSISEESGIDCCADECSDEARGTVDLLISVLRNGLCSIEQEYKEYLRVTEREEK